MIVHTLITHLIVMSFFLSVLSQITMKDRPGIYDGEVIRDLRMQREEMERNKPYIEEEPPVILQPETEHKATLIFLHGRGETGEKLLPFLTYLRQPYMKVICPTGNYINVTNYKTVAIHTWYDIYEDGEDIRGLEKVTNYIHNIINKEVKSGIPPKSIILGGMAQGGSAALYIAKRYPRPLGAYFHPANKDIPLLQCHGKGDAIFANGHDINAKFQYKTYSGIPYSITEEEMDVVKEFIRIHSLP